MNGSNLPQGAAVLAALLLLLGAAFQVLLAMGLPLGHAAWGGRHRVLPARLRWGSAASALVLGAAALVVLARADLAPPGSGSVAVRIATWTLAALLALNTLGNLASRSRTERAVMAPITLLLVLCFLVVALYG